MPIAKGIELLLRCAPIIPEQLVGDSGRLRQVLVNLVGNAIKFTDAGHVLVEMTGRVQGDSFAAMISVEDTGIGVSDAHVDRIFDQFTQAEGYIGRTYGGTGLGLAICRSLVDAMGGQLHVTSEPGRGSRFWIDIELPIAAPAKDRVGAKDWPDGARVLVVNGNDVSQGILCAYLSEMGLVPMTADSASSALDHLTQAATEGHPVRLAFIDAPQPAEDCAELIKQIGEAPDTGGMEIVLLCSAVVDETAQPGRRLGRSARADEARTFCRLGA